MTGSSGGVDVCPVDAVTEETLVETVAFVKAVSKRLGAVLCGDRCDRSCLGRTAVCGDPRRKRGDEPVTGTGCQLSGLAAAFLAVARNMEAPAGSTVREYCGRSSLRGARHGGGRGGSLRDECSRRDCVGAARFMRRKCLLRDRYHDAVYRMDQKMLEEGFIMKCDKRDLLLYAVTDRSWSEGTTLGGQVEEALRGGATFVQLREKKADRGSTPCGGVGDQAVCRRYGVPFVMLTTTWRLRKRLTRTGVHVGQDDMEAGDVRAILGADKIIGVSAHNVEEALRAERHGADYLGVGAAFTTSSNRRQDTLTRRRYVPSARR